MYLFRPFNMTKDSYYTIAIQDVEARLTIQRSRFLGYAYTVKSIEESEDILGVLRKKFFDATHVCYAYTMGIDGNLYRMDDNGEPSGTAGRPILGKIRSFQLSDVLVVVVRYFGGVKLGTGGLIKAYGETAELTLEAAKKKEIILTEELFIAFKPNLTGIVMNKVNIAGASILQQGFEAGNSTLTIAIRKSKSDLFCSNLNKIFGISAKKIVPLQSD